MHIIIMIIAYTFKRLPVNVDMCTCIIELMPTTYYNLSGYRVYTLR